MNTVLRQVAPMAIASALLVGCSAGSKPPAAGQSYEQLARAIIHRQDQVSAEDLADWIIKDTRDFVLLDIRPQKEFEVGHIQSAQNMPLTYLVERETLAGLPADRRLIVYSDGNRKAAQAVVMLRLAGLNAYALLGGYNFWTRHVLHPQLPAAAGDDEILEFHKQQAVACYFAGNYKGGQGGSAPQRAGGGYTPRLHRKAPARKGKKGAPKIEEGC